MFYFDVRSVQEQLLAGDLENVFPKVSPTSQEEIFVGVPFYQIAGLDLANLSKKRVRHMDFPVSLVRGYFWTLRAVL